MAEAIDALAAKDEMALERATEIAGLRRRAAVELHATCAAFAAGLNGRLARTRVALDPPEYTPDLFREEGPNLLQINVRGRILQIEFETTPELVSTEDFRVPYTLAGSIRCFNQQLLEQEIIVEHLLFYCLEKQRPFWRFFDERTYRSGPFDLDYLVALMEQLV